MDNNTICQITKEHFKTGDEIFVVKPDEKFKLRRFFQLHRNCREFYLSTKAFEKVYAENVKFRSWWNINTEGTRMSTDDAQEKYGVYWLEVINDASYYTRFEPETDDCNIRITGNGTREEVANALRNLATAIEGGITNLDQSLSSFEDGTLLVEIH